MCRSKELADRTQMFQRVSPAWRSLAALLVLLCGTQASAQDFMFSTETEVPRIVGAAVGVVPDFMGSSDYQFGVAPFLRYQLTGRKQYLQLLGPELSFNLLNADHWRFGPLLNYRFGRDSDVEDSAVSRMRNIKDTVEGGAFAEWFYSNPEKPRQRFVVGGAFQADLGDGHEGMIGRISARMWQPVAKMVDLNFGVGMMFADDDFTDTYFGVDARDAVRSGLRRYDADGGATDVRMNFGAVVYLSHSWAATAGLQYRRLLGDAADSPVTDQGSKNQFIAGAGVAYMW